MAKKTVNEIAQEASCRVDWLLRRSVALVRRFNDVDGDTPVADFWKENKSEIIEVAKMIQADILKNTKGEDNEKE